MAELKWTKWFRKDGFDRHHSQWTDTPCGCAGRYELRHVSFKNIGKMWRISVDGGCMHIETQWKRSLSAAKNLASDIQNGVAA